jgi:hypothetical protein
VPEGVREWSERTCDGDTNPPGDTTEQKKKEFMNISMNDDLVEG